MNTVPEPRTAAALAARRSKTETALLRVREFVARLRREKAQVSVAAVARRQTSHAPSSMPTPRPGPPPPQR